MHLDYVDESWYDKCMFKVGDILCITKYYTFYIRKDLIDEYELIHIGKEADFLELGLRILSKQYESQYTLYLYTDILREE